MYPLLPLTYFCGLVLDINKNHLNLSYLEMIIGRVYNKLDNIDDMLFGLYIDELEVLISKSTRSTCGYLLYGISTDILLFVDDTALLALGVF
jgi:hypothetical protein